MTGLALAPAGARASDATTWIALTWEAPTGCPDAAYVEHEVARLLGIPPAAAHAPEHPTEAPMRLAAALSAMVDTGTLPAPTPGFAARLAITPGALSALRLELGVGLFLDDAMGQPSARSGTFSLRVADAGACLVTRTGRVELGACASVEVDWIAASGLYESAPSRGNAEWPVPRGRATGAYLLTPRWALRADAGAGVDLIRPDFAAAGATAGPIHQPARFTGRAALGLELTF